MTLGDLVTGPAIAFLTVVVFGPLLIPLLQRWKVGQHVRDQGPESHRSKSGTPTMGGILFLVGLAVATIIMLPGGPREFPETYLLFCFTAAFGLLGFLDDYTKVVLKRPLGLRARTKLVFQILMALALGFFTIGPLQRGTWLQVPFGGPLLELELPVYLAFTVLVVLGTVNAVNLTDGLDGLAAGSSAVVLITYTLVALAAGRMAIAAFALSLAAACIAFLRFNYHPARIFMGDTGSFALGAAISGIAILTKTELLLPVIGGVFVLETLSVILQVFSFRLLGRRIFRMSPLHHHFELAGWSETIVVNRFWLVTAFLAFLGFLGLKGFGGAAG